MRKIRAVNNISYKKMKSNSEETREIGELAVAHDEHEALLTVGEGAHTEARAAGTAHMSRGHADVPPVNLSASTLRQRRGEAWEAVGGGARHGRHDVEPREPRSAPRGGLRGLSIKKFPPQTAVFWQYRRSVETLSS